jgi:hypothetical protein
MVLLILDDCESLFICVMLSEVEVVGLVATVATTAASATSASSVAILVLILLIGRAIATFGLELLLPFNNGGTILSNWGLSSSGGLSCSDWLGNCLSLLFDLSLFFLLLLGLMFVRVVVDTLLSEKGLTISSL